MEIQEQVLTLAAMEQDLTLKRITEFMYAQDTGRKSRKLLSEAGSLNKLRQHKMQQREQSNTMPGNTAKPCFLCGVPSPRRSSERAITTSPLVPILAAALLRRHLHSTPGAVIAADGLPVGHATRPDLCQFSCQNQTLKPEHSQTLSSQVIPASDSLFILL